MVHMALAKGTNILCQMIVTRLWITEAFLLLKNGCRSWCPWHYSNLYINASLRKTKNPKDIVIICGVLTCHKPGLGLEDPWYVVQPNPTCLHSLFAATTFSKFILSVVFINTKGNFIKMSIMLQSILSLWTSGVICSLTLWPILEIFWH